jgi:hypothetical protein
MSSFYSDLLHVGSLDGLGRLGFSTGYCDSRTSVLRRQSSQCVRTVAAPAAYREYEECLVGFAGLECAYHQTMRVVSFPYISSCVTVYSVVLSDSAISSISN